MSPSGSPLSPLKVLIVDDDTFIADILKKVAEKLGCNVKCIHNGNEVSPALVAYNPDVIFLDLVLPGIDGVEIIHVLSQAGCKAKIVLMSGLDKRTLSSVSEVAKKSQLHLMGAVTKPFAPGQVESILQPLIEANTEKVEVDEVNQAISIFGPQILYEPEIPVNASQAGEMNWVRVSLVWRMDDEQLTSMSKILAESAAPNLARGLIEFTLRQIYTDQKLLNSAQPNMGIKLPISNEMLTNEAAPDFLDQIVKRNNLFNQSIMLEISEDSILNSSESTFNVLSRLKIKGFKLAVCIREQNDMVLTILNKLPIDELVLDMAGSSYREDQLRDAETEFQVASLVSYASSAGLTTSAKNVHSQQQNSFVERCRLAQVSGKYVQSPADSGTIVNFFGKR